MLPKKAMLRTAFDVSLHRDSVSHSSTGCLFVYAQTSLSASRSQRRPRTRVGYQREKGNMC